MPSIPRIGTWLSIAPSYIDFSIKFLRSPSDALASEKGSGTISKDLANLMLGGVAVAYALLLAFGVPPSPLNTGALAKDSLYIPAAVLGIVVMAAGLLHATVGYVLRRKGSTGCMEDTVNAALALSAILIPWCSAAVCTLSILPKSLALPVGLPVACSPGILLIAYLPLAISATHPNTGRGNAYLVVTIVGGTAIVVAEALFGS